MISKLSINNNENPNPFGFGFLLCADRLEELSAARMIDAYEDLIERYYKSDLTLPPWNPGSAGGIFKSSAH